jgi:hypothetical protein
MSWAGCGCERVLQGAVGWHAVQYAPFTIYPNKAMNQQQRYSGLSRLYRGRKTSKSLQALGATLTPNDLTHLRVTQNHKTRPL